MIYDKTKRYQNMPFFKIPKDVLNYLYLDGVNASTLLIYVLICDLYDSKEGYAYPSHDTLGLMAGMRRETIGTHIKTLAKYGLIRIFAEGAAKGKRYKYKPQIPMSRDELFLRYPKAREKYEKNEQKVKKRYELVEITDFSSLEL
jgi:biotin operon repressor